MELATIEAINIWAFVFMAFLWMCLLGGAATLYAWLIKHDAKSGEDFHLGL